MYYNGPLQYSYDRTEFADVIQTCRANGTSNMVRSIDAGIVSPTAYLETLYPNGNFTVDAMDYIWGVKAYNIADLNACSVYGVAALITYHLRNTDRRPFSEVVEACKKIARDYGYATQTSSGEYDYYMDLGYLQPFATKCIQRYSLNLTAESSMTQNWVKAKNEINNNRPVLINISTAPGSGYSDHTVTAYGWSTYRSDAYNLEYDFYKVYDGYSLEIRYVDVVRMNIYFITRMY